jgi:hypothetical protein
LQEKKHEVEFTLPYNVRQKADVCVGNAAAQFIKEKKMKDAKVDSFFKNVTAYYTSVCQYMVDNLSFEEQFLRSVKACHPEEFVKEGALAKLQRLREQHPILVPLGTACNSSCVKIGHKIL